MRSPAIIGLAFFVTGLHQAQAVEEIDFNRDIKPILSQNCFACHGPDGHDRKAGLRLDVREAAIEKGAFKPGVPEESEMMRRIASADADEVMPPPESNKTLDAEQQQLLKRWIAEGATYKEHWSFIPPQPQRPPASASQDDWCVNPTDPFILAEIEKAGLRSSESAARGQVIRRLTFDLTGLPPSVEDVQRFVRDDHLNAYERLTDRLMASPHYGERMALAWMDAARYGDTSVMHADGNRDMWPWRDWVIASYNANKPFDEFTVEQLAGDLLPEATMEQKIASGFNRNHATSDEGGAIPEELRVEYVVDRVKTTSNVWLALTMECGQCHDHKYDPISQREYYQFFAYFNNTKDPGMQTRRGNQAPVVRVLSDSRRRELREVRAKLARLEKDRQESQAPVDEVDRWRSELRENPDKATPSLGSWRLQGPFQGKNEKEAFDKDFGPEKNVSTLKIDDWEPVAYAEGEVHQLDLKDHQALYLAREIHSPFHHQTELKFGSGDGLKVWLNGKSLHAKNDKREAAADQNKLKAPLNPGHNLLLVKVSNRKGKAGFYFNWQAPSLPDKVTNALAAETPTEKQQQELANFYTKKVWGSGLELDKRIAKTKEDEQHLLSTAPTSMMMEDNNEKPRMTYLLKRGQYDQPQEDEVIPPGVPSALPPLPTGAREDRLGLAEWLTQPNHPLTARVAVNRYWNLFFGRGLVSTIGDFGSQGAWPSHPELLDALAVEFVRSGWDVKHLVRQLVTSATYRQSAAISSNMQVKDPKNTLLARSPRFRLQGEFVRDQALALSGLLVHHLGGPGVKPYQPPNIWNEVSLNGGLRYKQDNGRKLYRRSMYTFWKRSAPMPNMMIFDAPTREKCALDRPRTNTPLQALVTLNDPQFVEAARVWATRLLGEGIASDEKRIHHAAQQAMARKATSREVDILTNILNGQRETFRAHPDQAKELLSVGEFPVDESLDAADLAAWTIVMQMVLNLDETLTRG